MTVFDDLERAILWVLAHSSKKNPITLDELIHGIDAREHMIIMREELLPAISKLFQKGYVQEAAHLQYFIVNPPSPDQSFSGISEAEFEGAVDRYLSKPTEEEDPDEGWKITIEWASIGNQSHDEAEKWLDRLGDQFQEHLDNSRYSVDGFDVESGPMMGVYALREAQSVDTDQLYNQLLPLIKKSSLPLESQLLITKHYSDSQNQEISFG